MIKIFHPQKEDLNKRMDLYLSQKLNLSRSQIKNLITQDKVSVDKQKVKKSGEQIKDNSVIEVQFEEQKPLKAFAQDIPLDIIYEDEDIAVVNKPVGMVTHLSDTTRQDTLVNACMYHIKNLSDINGELRLGIVHRLDKGTSGLLVIAKNNDAHISLAKQISEKTAQRHYLGVVHGNIKDDEGEIDKPIARHSTDRKKMGISPKGRVAKTFYKVLERFMDFTFLEFQLHTGRTHQIRVHCKYIQHPIVGDNKYGIKEKFTLKSHLLHAYKLIIEHPRDGRQMEFIAPLPDYFEKFLNKLRQNFINP